MALGVTLPHFYYFYGFDGLKVLRDGETEFKVRSDPRALLCALRRYHGAKHALCTLGVLKDGEIEFKVHSYLRALLRFRALSGAKHVICTLAVLSFFFNYKGEHGSAGIKRSGSHLLYWHNLFIDFIK
jgi:hypothetical protein